MGHRQHHTELLCQADVVRFHAHGKREIAGVHELSQSEVSDERAQIHTGTHSAACAEGKVSEFLSLVIQLAMQPSLGPEFQRIVPQFGISVQSVQVHEG